MRSLSLSVGLLLLVVACAAAGSDDDDDTTSSLPETTALPVTASTPYLHRYNNVCVGAGTLYKEALPCPFDAQAPCIYTINMTAWAGTPWGPTLDFLVLASGADFTAWDNNQPYNCISAASTDSFTTTFYVQPGQTFIYLLSNENTLFNINFNGAIEFFPNTAFENDVDTAVPESGATRNNSMDDSVMFAIGFYVALVDAQPYTPPNQNCLNSIEGIEDVMNSLLAEIGPPSLEGAQHVWSQLMEMYHFFKNASATCNKRFNSCPGFLLGLLDDAIKIGIDMVPEIKVFEEGVSILVNGWDVMKDIALFESASGPDMYYTRGFSLGRIVVHVKAALDNLEHIGRRDLAATQADLRYNDGVVRTLAEWRSLYPHDLSAEKSRN